MPKDAIIFKPRYKGSMRFAVLLWPVWAGLAVYFLYQGIITQSYNPQGLLAFIFGAMTVTLPLRIFRQARFKDEIIVKRFFMSDLKIEYKDITALTPYGLKARSGNLSLQMLSQESILEFAKIINILISEKKIKMKKIV
jgi:hypothetical protein